MRHGAPLAVAESLIRINISPSGRTIFLTAGDFLSGQKIAAAEPKFRFETKIGAPGQLSARNDNWPSWTRLVHNLSCQHDNCRPRRDGNDRRRTVVCTFKQSQETRAVRFRVTDLDAAIERMTVNPIQPERL